MNAVSERGRRAALAAGAAVAVLHVLVGRGHAFGAATDEAYLARLALALRGGAYALPGPFGGPVTDPLPGYPALIAPAVWALAPRWDALWFLGLAATLSCAWLSWRLARRLLEARAAAAVGLLVALSPALVAQAGSVLPDAAFAALCAAGFLVLDGERGGAGSFAALAALGALAALVRPYGALLPAALALGLGLRRGPRRAAALLAVALAPLAACLARNESAAGFSTGYALRWSEQLGGLGLAVRARAAAAAVLGRGALGLPALPELPAAAAGLAFAAAAAVGARRLARGGARPVVAAMAFFAAALLAVHLTWRFSAPRYALPLLAPLWIFAAAAAARARPPMKRAAAAAAFLLGAAALWSDAGLAAEALERRPPALSRTAAWIRANLPEDARLESFSCQPLELLGGRAVACATSWDPREAWLNHLEDARIGWVHELPVWHPDGYLPPGMDQFIAQSQGWLRDPADFEPVFADPDEGVIYRLKPRDEARDHAAWAAFLDGRAALESGDAAGGKARLIAALRFRPRFAYAWALLATLEKDPAKAAVLLRRAVVADPASARVRAAFAQTAAPTGR